MVAAQDGRNGILLVRKKHYIKEKSTLEEDQTEVSAIPMITEIYAIMKVKDSAAVLPPPIHHR